MDPILKDHEIVKYLQLWSQRSGRAVDAHSFELGRMSIALSIESQARIFEEFGSLASLSIHKELVASALRDLLRSLKIDDDVLDVYDSVCVMKVADQPRYVPVSEPDELTGDHASSSQPSGQHQTWPQQLTLGEYDQEHRKFLRLWGSDVVPSQASAEGESAFDEGDKSPG